MKSNFEKISLLISIIFFIITAVVFVFLYREIDNNKKTSEQAQIDFQIESNRRDEMRSLDRSIKQIEIEKADLETHFAPISDIVPFLDTIEKLGPDAGVTAAVYSVDALKDNSGLVVGMKASGTFESVYKFLTLLENSSYELEFSSVDIQKSGDQPDPSSKIKKLPTWEAVFKIKLLSFVP